MKKHTNPLDQVRVAAPCPSDWERMVGNERVRFCAQCSLNVYNLSGMTRAEAERLIGSSEGRLCVRFYRRADGTILTKNCPVGLRALKQRMTRMATALASLLLSFLAGVLAFAGLQKSSSTPNYGPGYTQGTITVRPVAGQNATTSELGEMAGPPSVTTGTMAVDPALFSQGRIRRHR
ncbi:MAG TPA: hypothetical protein VGC64_07195 [Pyrinomonadaceae bacterium]